MIGRALLCAAVAYLPALAQFQLTVERSGAVCNTALVTDLGTAGITGATFTFRITNTSSAGAQVDRLELNLAPQYANAFAILNAPATPFVLVSKGFQRFDLKLTPDTVGAYRADLRINNDLYGMQATVQAGAGDSTGQPKFRIVVEPETLKSGVQAALSLKFDAPAVTSGAGLLTMDFIGKGDPAIAFISPASRSVPFTIAAGEDTAKFTGETSIGFQTGTTAGDVIFTATLAPDTPQEETETDTFHLAPEPVWVDAIRHTSATGQLTVSVSSFDNTRSVSQVRFTFYDRAGKTIGSTVTADVTTVFQAYFKNPEMGGMFVLRAQFPVTGDATQIDSVRVELTNSAGVTSASAKIAE
ncbi:MAG TPA: hypothetical protein VF767_05430 [Bryobacteraceae bacterium]